MRNIILSSLVVGAAFAGFVGAQIAQSASETDAAAMIPAITATGSPQSPAAFGDNVQSPNPVVVELFTSQGCSSCPPADMLASRLAKDEALLVITRPVTYWDRLGWKDTLAREDNTRLQRAYARKGLKGSGVYTPQIVVNGADAAVGSREHDIRSLVRRSRGASNAVITTSETADGRIMVTVSGRSRHMASVSLLALSSSETVRVGRGENGGRTLHYTNVVKQELNLGGWDGSTKSFSLASYDLDVPGADRYAVIVQRPGAGTIMAARMLDIRG